MRIAGQPVDYRHEDCITALGPIAPAPATDVLIPVIAKCLIGKTVEALRDIPCTRTAGENGAEHPGEADHGSRYADEPDGHEFHAGHASAGS